MKSKSMLFLHILISALLFTNCSVPIEYSDPLPSWNDTNAKKSIVDFVEDVTNKESPNYVAPADRIATFDNDGTIWSEQPIYFQIAFVLDRIKELAPRHPEWKNTQPFKAVLENNMKSVMAQGEEALIKLLISTHTGMTVNEFKAEAANWIDTAKHSQKKVPYTDLIFQPMLEVINYLHDNDFKVFIVSGGSIDFMRPWIPEKYGIPSERIIGSTFKTEYNYNDGDPVINRLPGLSFNNDKAGKPVSINKFIGKRPIAAFGNSDGDLQMLQYTDSDEGRRLLVYIHHTDAEREWAYDRESHIGKLNNGLDEGRKKGWTIVDMKKDWKVIYPL